MAFGGYWTYCMALVPVRFLVQAQTSSGHIQAATLESSKANWQLSALGIGGQVEEQDVRLPPLPPGRPFNDCYEVWHSMHDVCMGV